jgi:hypothetical protein
MNTIARVMLVAVLALGSGCTKPDWIQQTLVTVDVTGTWQSSEGSLFVLKLDQQGSRVTGSLLMQGIASAASVSGAIEGSVAGDVFRFKQTSGNWAMFEGQMNVSGDEMSGTTVAAQGGRRFSVLRRVDSSRPNSPQQ